MRREDEWWEVGAKRSEPELGAGAWTDRLGRERVTIRAMAVSGACALGIGWLMNAPLVLALGPAAGIAAMRRLKHLRTAATSDS